MGLVNNTQTEDLTKKRVYSIAEAKNSLPVLVHSVESEGLVKISRRGKVVAYLISTDYFQKITSTGKGFFSDIKQITEKLTTKDLLEESEIDSWRDVTGGREIAFES